MNPEDIIGKTVDGLRFESTQDLSYSDEHERYVGTTGIVKEIHSIKKDYCKVVYDSNYLYYPVACIMEQLRYDDMTEEDIFKEIHDLLSSL